MRRRAAVVLGLVALAAPPCAAGAATPDPSPLWSQYPLDNGPAVTTTPELEPTAPAETAPAETAPAETAPPETAPATTVPSPGSEPPAPSAEPATTAPRTEGQPTVTEAAGPPELPGAAGSAAGSTSGGSPWPLAWTLVALTVAAAVVQVGARVLGARGRRRHDDDWLERQVERLSAPDGRPSARRDDRPRA